MKRLGCHPTIKRMSRDMLKRLLKAEYEKKLNNL